METTKPLVNKIEASGLIVLKPDELIQKEGFLTLDFNEFLTDGLLLKEKKFREDLKALDLSIYRDKIILIHTSVDAIIPMWAYMLLSSELMNAAKDVVFGNMEIYQNLMFNRFLSQINPANFEDKRVVVKGCGKIQIPEWVYVEITNQLKPVVKSLMFGEPCSTVPIFKKN
jgi:hypothetical protein